MTFKMKSACVALACLISSAQAYQPSSQAGLSRRRVFEGLGWTGGAAVLGAPSAAFAAAKAAPAAAVPLEAELVKKGDGPLVKDGDYAFVDFTGWLDGFAGKEVIDSSNANGGQAVKVPIGPGDTTPQGLLANVGRGGTVAKPVIVPMPIGINEVLSNGAAPRNPDGSLAIQGSTKDYQNAAHVGSRYRIKIPADKAFGKAGGVSGSGATIPPGATLYYEVRIRAKTGKLSTGA
eukprot:CAMPEP_0182532038 /NCGR_PEP_ID=MMETSP1323-20130603/10609_1 /TAXON_ID=236787 /ORGANISM="Florenciella parvula, Strain RCC1693" /LENGTH=233 /DNA_ID=CAMNT_0024741709 /DNA_START=22 /DNA_END=723 /DNA_ORIENTATION=+